jgi:hypothetical protein
MSKSKLIISAVACLTLAGCGEYQSAKTNNVAVGTSQNLQGSSGEATVRITKIVDPLPSSDLATAQPGRKLTAVFYTIRNRGQKAFPVVPASDLELQTSQGPAPYTVIISGPCQGKLSEPQSVKPGQTISGCAVFQPVRSSKLTATEFSLGSGLGSGRRYWNISQ